VCKLGGLGLGGVGALGLGSRASRGVPGAPLGSHRDLGYGGLDFFHILVSRDTHGAGGGG